MTSDVFDCQVPNAIPQEGHGLIYLYTFDNGMMYVGQTSTRLSSRHNGHVNGDQIVDRFIRKHKFRLDILGLFTKSELDIQEQYFIKELDTISPKGLNFESGGHDNKIMSITSREKMSLAKKGKPSPKKGIKTGKPSWNKGKKFSEESRRKMSESHIGEKQSIETRLLKSEISKNTWADPNIRSKRITAMKVIHNDPLIQMKRVDRLKQHYIDHPESRTIKSEQSKERWADKNYKKKMMDALSSQEVKSKIGRAIVQLDFDTGELINAFLTIQEANANFNVNRSHISACCIGDRKICLGYKWMYLDDYIYIGSYKRGC